jgi:protein O-mannosyl-transferase
MKKKKSTSRISSATTGSVNLVRPQKLAKPGGSSIQNWLTLRSNWFLMLFIAMITFAFYASSLQNQFTHWDDPGYVLKNYLIKDFSANGIKNIFSTSVMGNYHPLTILTYSIEYHFFKLDPFYYHLNSVLLHILVSILVFVFTNKLVNNKPMAFLTAAFFALHPMHVESVAWISGRKDLVYSIFYIGALITYLNYIRSNKKNLWFLATIVLFIASLLGKPVAVVLPISVLLLDYFENRKINFKLFLEKIPFLAIAVAFGIKSLLDQKEAGALTTENINFNIIERIGIGSYAMFTYIWKAVLPVQLSAFYPYPDKTGGSLDSIYFIYPVVIAGILLLAYKLRKNRLVVFGSLFFFVNIVLLLQFIPVGAAVMADRYSYIPYLGLFLIMAAFFNGDLVKNSQWLNSTVLLPAAFIFLIVLGTMTQSRSMVWADTISLWRDVLKTYPNEHNAHNNLGYEYSEKYDRANDENTRKLYFDSTLYFLNRAIEIKPGFAKTYVTVGELFRSAGNFGEAGRFYHLALSVNEKQANANAHLGLGILQAMMNNIDSSEINMREAIAAKKIYPEAHNSYGNLQAMKGNADSALYHYQESINQDPDYYGSYYNKARIYQNQGKYNEAISNINQAIVLMPDMGELYYFRSMAYNGLGNKAAAINDVQKAIALGYQQVDNNYYNSLSGQ